MGRVLIAGFTAALLLLLTLILHLTSAPSPEPGPGATAEVRGAPPPPADRPRPLPAFRPVAAPAGAPRTPALAALRGQVVGGDDVDAAEELEVRVVDQGGSRPTVAAACRGRTFEARLPPGTYTVRAELGELVGKLADVQLTAGAPTELVISLQPEVILAGRVVHDGKLPSHLRLRVYTAGTQYNENNDFVSDDGLFELRVAPGVYDLELTGLNTEGARLSGVRAPVEGLELRLPQAIVLRGAVGMPPGQPCAISEVMVRAGEEQEIAATVDARCRFEAIGVPPGEVLVQASGDGWLVEGNAVIPERGRPEFVCLNPPCGDVLVARVEVRLDGVSAPQTDGRVYLNLDQPGRSSKECDLERGRCEFVDLPVGRTARLTARGSDCRGEERSVVLAAGLNRVTIPCHRTRRVEAFVRAPGPPPVKIDVRCGDQENAAQRSFFVRTNCAIGVRELQYRLDGATGWRAVALTDGVDPILVELAAPAR